MIYCKELNTSYNNKEELFKALKENKKKIIDIKKKTIYTGYNPNEPENSKQVVSNSQTKLINSLSSDTVKELFNDTDNYFYLAVNTTRILDSHNDLHMDTIWNKSAKEQSGKNYLVDTHSLTVKNTIVYPDDIEIFTAKIPFKAINKNYEGDTVALIYKFAKDSVRCDKIKQDLQNGKPLQASVKMQYVTMELAMNSDREEDKEEKKAFDETVNSIANLKDFNSLPLYYVIVKEAKNIHESSLVPFGSNGATGQIKNIEPSKDTQNKEAAVSTSNLLNIYQNFKF